MALNLLSREALLTEKKMAGNLCGFLPKWIMQSYKSFVMLMDIRHDISLAQRDSFMLNATQGE